MSALGKGTVSMARVRKEAVLKCFLSKHAYCIGNVSGTPVGAQPILVLPFNAEMGRPLQDHDS